MKPAVSLVIAVYNRPDVLELVFASLHNQTFDDFEVVVADDGSGPEVAALIEREERRLAHRVVHEWHEDRGFRKTIVVNRAVTRASADYLVFIDGDCILHRRFVERHFVRRRRGRVLTGRRVMLDEELTSRLTRDDVSSRRIERPWFWLGHCGRNDCKHGFYVPFAFALRNRRRADYPILGCNFSVHRDDFFAVNGYDERIVGRGLEDNNLFARFVNSGLAVNSIAFEALQYHCYHSSDAMPHSDEFIAAFHHTREKRTPCGIVKE